MQVGEFGRQLRFVGELANAVEFGRESRESALFDALLVHAGGVVVADLAGDGVAARVGFRGGFEDLAQRLLVALVEFVEAPPARLVGWNRIALQPVAAGVLVEILARVRGLIDRLHVETHHGSIGRRRLRHQGKRAQ